MARRTAPLPISRRTFLLGMASSAAYPAAADEPYFKPTSFGGSFDGPALKLSWVRLLANPREAGRVRDDLEKVLVDAYRAADAGERDDALAELVESVTLEPEFTEERGWASLRALGRNSYCLACDDRDLRNRILVNAYVARGIAALARERLIDNTKASLVIPALLRCQSHPWAEVGTYAHRALRALTLHGFGRAFWERSAGSRGTKREHDEVAQWWRRWWQRNEQRYPIFDEALAQRCRAAPAQFLAAFRNFGAEQVAQYLETGLGRFPAAGSDNGIDEPIVQLHYDIDQVAWASTPRSAQPDLLYTIYYLDQEAPPLLRADGDPVEYTTERYVSLNLAAKLGVRRADTALRENCRAAFHASLRDLKRFAERR